MSQGRDHAGGSRKKRPRFHNKNFNLGDMGKEVLEKLDESSQVMKQFREYAAELDDKHDRFERIVKISRDITIESKRIIFFLHTLDKDEKKESILNDAEKRLENVTKFSFKNIAKELDGQDVYQYIKAYRAGVQEFIEATTFHQYLKNKELQDWNQIGKTFSYMVEDKSKSMEKNSNNQETILKKQEVSPNNQEMNSNNQEMNPNNQEINSTKESVKCANQLTLSNQRMKNIQTPLLPSDYILGIADLTGELMRKCINNLSSGNIAGCFETCIFVRSMYQGFMGCIGISGREINRKLITLKQSLNKIENVCYTIKIRGSEIPKHMLASVAIADREENIDEDEGFSY